MTNVILGYIFTVFNYVFYCGSRFFGKKKKMLLFDLLAKASFFAALFFLGSLSGAYSTLVTIVLLIIVNIKERREARWTIGYALFEALYIFILISNFEGLSTVLIFVTSSVSLLSYWWLSPQKMRIAGLVTCVLSLCYQLSIKNWAGLLEIIVIVSNVVSFIKYYREEKKGRLTNEQSI